jgi:hypothetical protein
MLQPNAVTVVVMMNRRWIAATILIQLQTCSQATDMTSRLGPDMA